MSVPVVAHVVQHLRPGGIESLALEMLRSEGGRARQFIVSLDGAREEAIASWPRLAEFADRLRFLDKPQGLAPLLPLRLARLLRAEGAAVVQTHHVGPLLYGGLAARLAGLRLVHVEHDAWHLRDPGRARLMRRLLRLLRPRLAAVSDVVARNADAHLRRAVTIIRNGVDTDRFSPGDKSAARTALGLPDRADAALLVCAARLEHVKGVDVLVDAMRFLPPSVHLAIAGDGSMRGALEAEAERIAPRRIRFLGRIDDMPTLFRAGDLCVLPSRAEGLPLSLLEAQSAGCPAVATDVGGMPDAVDPASGAVVRAENPEEMATAILALLGRSEAANPRGFVERGYAIASMMDAYARLWRGAAA